MTEINLSAQLASLQTRRTKLQSLLAEPESVQQLLGLLQYGKAAEPGPAAALGHRSLPAGFGLPVLSSNDGLADCWLTSDSDQQSGECGLVRWRCDGNWLFGDWLLSDADQTDGIACQAQRAYADIFATLIATGHHHLLRVWNYIPDINVETEGIERYRQFNAGRQQAFLDARRMAFEGAPAACALGTQRGPLRVSFLAGRSGSLALENPRQISAYRYPSSYGARSPSFSRAALIEAGPGRVGLLISGTSSIVGHQSVFVGDVRAQTSETLTNLRSMLQVANARSTARFELSELHTTVYLRNAADLPTIREEFELAVGSTSSAARNAIYLQADICRSDLGVEIEGHILTDGELRR